MISSASSFTATDAQFDHWARSFMLIAGSGTSWSLSDRTAFCDQLWQADAIVLLRV